MTKMWTQDEWQPALEMLVQSINDKFRDAFCRKYLYPSLLMWCWLCRLGTGNAGEVQIVEHEDYDKWALEILVKFRDTEKLQPLNAHRQSGGVSYYSTLERLWSLLTRLKERALSTMLYLMSLTDVARSPFSLVDEINQVCIIYFYSSHRVSWIAF